MPFLYALDRLAQRWGVAPWELTKPLPPDQDRERAEWLVRSLDYQRTENSMTKGKDG